MYVHGGRGQKSMSGVLYHSLHYFLRKGHPLTLSPTFPVLGLYVWTDTRGFLSECQVSKLRSS